MKLSDKEKEYINSLEHPLYTAEFCDDWLERKPVKVSVNAPAALQQVAVEGFVTAVRAMMKKEGIA